MIKRTIVITSASKVTLKNNQLICINLEDQSIIQTAPIEDLGIVIVENQKVIMTVPLINALSNNNVSLIYCNSNYMPNSMMCSLSHNSTQNEMVRYQISVTEAAKNRIWKQLIEAKIKNQANLLNKIGKDGNILKTYYSNVKSGDSDNREGIAAKIYWKELLGKEFVRDRNGISPNNMLNYGYSILRSAVARALMGSGLLPFFGIFHRNKYNSMPLVDDLIEPFRPFVDEIVYMLHLNGSSELTASVKKSLLGCIDCDTKYGENCRPLIVGLSITTASLGRFYMGNTKTLCLPELK